MASVKWFIGLFCLTIVPTLPGAERFTAHDLGRLLYRDAGSEAERFLVLDKIQPSGELECHVFGHTAPIRVSPGKVAKMIFYEHVPAFNVTQYALYSRLTGKTDTPAASFARICGDTTGRMEVIARYETARAQLLRLLREENLRRAENAVPPEIHEDNLRQLLEDAALFEIARKAAEQHDFTLAVALAQDWFRLVERSVPATSGGRRVGAAIQARQKELLVELFAAHAALPSPRRERFRARFPRARGLWSEPAASTYAELLRATERSLQSFVRLEDLSSILDFQEWGGAMLDVLFLVENSPAGKDLEEEFDQAMQEKTAGRQ